MAIGETWYNGANVCWEDDPSCTASLIIPAAAGDPDTDLVIQGNVGIGTTEPGQKLVVHQQAPAVYDSVIPTPETHIASFRIRGQNDNDFAALGIYGYPDTYEGVGGDYMKDTVMIYSHQIPWDTENLQIAASSPNGVIRFHTGGWYLPSTERMRIDNAGNVSIGTAGSHTKAGQNGFLDVQDAWLRDANGGSGAWASALGGEIQTWDSGWFPCEPGGTYPFNHDLGSQALITTLLYADNATGTNAFVCQLTPMGSATNEGSLIKNITATTLTVQAASKTCAVTLDSDGKFVKLEDGYFRVLAMRIN